ncbi:MAG: hypothetical protein LBF88_08945 [Planctomycetaceae bacterium]|nr:hypothetical protein [Planctomycetaceae bacterium]
MCITVGGAQCNLRIGKSPSLFKPCRGEIINRSNDYLALAWLVMGKATSGGCAASTAGYAPLVPAGLKQNTELKQNNRSRKVH